MPTVYRQAGGARRRPNYWRVVLAQAVTTVILSLLGAVMAGTSGLLSGMAGGLVSLIPNAYFVWCSQTVRRGSRSRQRMMRFYQAEAGKFGLTVALFAVVFTLAPPSNLAFFFGAYVAVLFTHWLTPWLVRG